MAVFYACDMLCPPFSSCQFAVCFSLHLSYHCSLSDSLLSKHTQAIPTRDVAVIPHGGPNLPYDRLDGTDRQHFFKGKKVILSNGLIHPMKGLQLMIWAMKQVRYLHVFE